MIEIKTPLLARTSAAAVAAIARPFLRSLRAFLRKTASLPISRIRTRHAAKTVNCRIRLKEEKEPDNIFHVFSVEISGTISTPTSGQLALMSTTITDITDGLAKASPVYTRLEQWRLGNSPVFCHTAQLGRLPDRVTTIDDWTTVARLYTDWLDFPRKGTRNLRFDIAITLADSGENLARGSADVNYENTAFGFVDIEQNSKRIKTLATTLAFAVSAANNNILDCEVALITDWTEHNLDFCQASRRDRQKLAKALKQAVAFFSRNQVDVQEICQNVVEIAPLSDRYEILDLCLRVAAADGLATTRELDQLNKIADCLDVDKDRFRTMMEKLLPISMHQVKDVEVALGITADMSQEQTDRTLRNEYRKWNARVTSSDRKVRTQANDMLRFIAEAKSQSITHSGQK